jgi:DNA-binding response OmpR family regulator
VAKILVVDDEFGIGELLRELLSEENHDVVLAVNGRQGLSFIAREKPDLILLDFMMPVLDGPGMLKAMAADPTMSSIPVIVMSSLPEATIRERAAGYRRYVRKPFNLDVILDIVGATLAGRGQNPGA